MVTLSACRNNLGSKGAEVLARALLSPGSTLQDLDLAANDLGFVGARTVASALANNVALRELDLSENLIGEDGARSLWEALMSNNGACKLKILCLQANRIGASGDHACFLAESLRVNRNLQHLDLSRNRLGDAGARQIAQGLAMNEGLLFLGLRVCEIQDAGFAQLVQGLGKNERLEELDLRDNVLTSLPRHFRPCLEVSWSPLRRLRLDGNPWPGDGAKAAQAARAVLTRNAEDWEALEAERKVSGPLPTLHSTQLRNASRSKALGEREGLDGVAPSRPWEMLWSEADGRYLYRNTRTGSVQLSVPTAKRAVHTAYQG